MDSYLSDQDYEFIYARVPRICVDLVIDNPEGILLCKRSIEPNLGLWNLPGGRIFINETIDQTISRIAQDELNIKIKKDKFLGFVQYFGETRKNVKNHSIALLFKVQIISGQPQINKQAQEFQYFPNLPQNMVPEQFNFLKDKLV